MSQMSRRASISSPLLYVMTRRRPLPLEFAVAACLFMATLSVQTGVAQQSQPAKSIAIPSGPTAVTKTATEEEGPANPQGTGIKVHGHWVLDVKDAVGKVVQHRDFQNSLVAGPGLTITSGDQILAGLLSGTASMDSLFISFVSGTIPAQTDTSALCSAGVVSPPPPAGVKCYAFVAPNSQFVLRNPTDVYKAIVNFQGAVSGLGESVTFSPTVAIILTGNFIVSGGLTEIDVVQTYATYCSPYITSTNRPRLTQGVSAFNVDADSSFACHDHGGSGGRIAFGAITSTPLATPLANLSTGQTITVTVTLSFS